MSREKQNITIAVTGPYGSGKTAVMQMIGRLLHDHGFQVDMYNSPGENYHDPATLAKIEKELPEKTNIQLVELVKVPSADQAVAERRVLAHAENVAEDHKSALDTLASPTSTPAQKATSAHELVNAMARFDALGDLLKNTANLIIPCWAENRKDKFIDSPVRQQVVIGGSVIETLPLRMGQRFDIIGLAFSVEALKEGLIDQTDSINQKNAALASLVFRTKNDAFVALPVYSISGAQFKPKNPDYKGQSALMTIDFEGGSALTLDSSTLDIFGNPLRVDRGSEFIVEYAISGRVNHQTGEVLINYSELRFYEATDGKRGRQLIGEDEPLKLEGYTLLLTRVNYNRSPR